MQLHLINHEHTREVRTVAHHTPGLAVLVLANGDTVDADPRDVHIHSDI